MVPAIVGSQSNRKLRNCKKLCELLCTTNLYKSSLLPSHITKKNPNNEINNSSKDYFVDVDRRLSLELAQIRMKYSKLKYHLKELHVTELSQCVCGYKNEDASHYFINCPLFVAERTVLKYKLIQIGCNLKLEYLLYGNNNVSRRDNMLLNQYVIDFINSTNHLL